MGWIVAAAEWLLIVSVILFEMPLFHVPPIGAAIQVAATSILAGPVWIVVAAVEFFTRRDRRVSRGDLAVLGAAVGGMVFYALNVLLGRD